MKSIYNIAVICKVLLDPVVHSNSRYNVCTRFVSWFIFPSILSVSHIHRVSLDSLSCVRARPVTSWWWHSLRSFQNPQLKEHMYREVLQDTGFHLLWPLGTPFCHVFKNALSIKVSKDNCIQSGALGMWPRSTIFGNDYHDLGRGALPILEFTGTPAGLDSADEIVILFCLFLFHITTCTIFL